MAYGVGNFEVYDTQTEHGWFEMVACLDAYFNVGLHNRNYIYPNLILANIPCFYSSGGICLSRPSRKELVSSSLSKARCQGI